MSTSHPLFVILSGKRKSGKDFLAEEIVRALGLSETCVTRISAPLKRAYAHDHGLDYDRLLDSSSYKEHHRAAMVIWGEDQRLKDPGFFCKLALKEVPATHSIVIITDARRCSDLDFFVAECGRGACLLVRIEASETTRVSRGWEYVAGIDDCETECGLDFWNDWDIRVENNTSGLSDDIVNKITKAIKTKQN